MDVFLVDDGSADGTDQSVRERYSEVNLIKGDGSLYWNGGMRVAFSAAMERDFDYYLWLNDDTLLYPTAINSLITTFGELEAKHGKSSIVVGSTQDPHDDRLSYGGVIRPNKWKTLFFKLVNPKDVPIECETMNGNCVLIPRTIAKLVGNLEKVFVHSMGDLDYGLRARYEGFSVWVMAGFAGTCSRNAVSGSFNDAGLPVAVRLRKMVQPKGLPLSSWRVFTQRHAGFLWPIFWLWPYARMMLKCLVKR
jgi:GT2 family glycosyltransferase